MMAIQMILVSFLLSPIIFLHSPYHITISAESFQKFYVQKRQGIEMYLTPSVTVS